VRPRLALRPSSSIRADRAAASRMAQTPRGDPLEPDVVRGLGRPLRLPVSSFVVAAVDRPEEIEACSRNSTAKSRRHQGAAPSRSAFALDDARSRFVAGRALQGARLPLRPTVADRNFGEPARRVNAATAARHLGPANHTADRNHGLRELFDRSSVRLTSVQAARSPTRPDARSGPPTVGKYGAIFVTH